MKNPRHPRHLRLKNQQRKKTRKIRAIRGVPLSKAKNPRLKKCFQVHTVLVMLSEAEASVSTKKEASHKRRMWCLFFFSIKIPYVLKHRLHQFHPKQLE